MHSNNSPYYTSEHCSTTTTSTGTRGSTDYNKYDVNYNEYDNSAWSTYPTANISTSYGQGYKWDEDEEKYPKDDFYAEMFEEPIKVKIPKTRSKRVSFENDNLKNEIFDIQLTVHELNDKLDEFIQIGNTFNQLVQLLTAFNQSMDTHHKDIMSQLKEMNDKMDSGNDSIVKTIHDSTEKTKEVISTHSKNIIERVHIVADITTDINERITIKSTRE
jgi:methyl-accepting chemotaxis protein